MVWLGGSLLHHEYCGDYVRIDESIWRRSGITPSIIASNPVCLQGTLLAVLAIAASYLQKVIGM
jgi:hypothetical protein